VRVISSLDPRRALSVPWIYEAFQRSVGKDRLRSRFVRDYMRPAAGERVVDIGCGPGDLIRFLPAVQYVGFDISREYIEAARQRFGSRATFVHGDLDDLTRATPDPVDTVVTVGVLHHVDDDEAGRILQYARSALREGGRFIAIEPCLFDGQHWMARRLLLADRGDYVRSDNEYRRLCTSAFADVDGHRDDHMYRVPYSVVVLECTASE